MCVYILLTLALVAPVLQMQLRHERPAAGMSADASARSAPGAIGRWRRAVEQFWAGQNIYQPVPQGPVQSPMPPRHERPVMLHPNMPFVVILLSPFAALPPEAMTLAWNLAKLAVLTATMWMLLGVAHHGPGRAPDRTLGLALLATLPMLIGDIQHGNTNLFVLGAIATHLWLYRRGRDLLAGASLALAICLKLTPAIFVLYWLFQRNARLLAGTLGSLVLFVVVVPMAAVGPARYTELTGAWLENLILPGLVKGDFYPVHMNQSLPGVFARYLLDGPGGNIHWNPDDNPYSTQSLFEWICFASLSPHTVKMITRAAQVAVVALVAAAIGWRRLPRDDGRRGLHYALVVVAMLLLNQRTWDHHAAVLLVAAVPLWYAAGYACLAARTRAAVKALLITAVVELWLTRMESLRLVGRALGRTGRDAGHFADVAEAYGPLFYHLLLLLAAGAILLFALRDRRPAYDVRAGWQPEPRDHAGAMARIEA